MSETAALPLTGIRCVEMCWVWAGPMMGQQLADLGAEVIKVEWYDRFDLYRTRGVERSRGKIPEPVRRESSFSFQSLNRNKLGLAVDLKREEGLDLVKDLIRESDIFIENFTVGTIDRLGLGPDVLKDLNERLVTVSLSATGRGSSLESLRSYGLMLSALGGYESLVTDEEGEFVGSPTFVMSDPNAALFGVLACLAGVLHSRETGKGATFECSQVEAVVSLVGAPTPAREKSVETICASADGGYLAVSLPGPGLAQLSLEDAAALRHWARDRTAGEITMAVEEAGGVTTPVLDLGETETAEVFAGTEVRQPSTHPITGPTRLVAAPWRINGGRAPIRKPAPLLGESNEYVLRSVVGRDEPAIAELHDSGVLDED